ncbi:YxlC family protein [Virgibacillus flavescens]|uniref:YxlC family protein n=1 Tax=Virgibacillus flavescens TaxID=1611422 RepID=UPI003D347463
MDNHKEESDTLKVLKADWESMDAIAGNPQMNQHDIQEQLQLDKRNRKRAFRKELSLFILTALMILGLFVTTILNSLETILYIQVCTALVGPVIYVFLIKREGEIWK